MARSNSAETVTVTVKVCGKTAKGIWVGENHPSWSSMPNQFIPYSQISESDVADIEEVEIGEEIEIEIPLWLAREKGLED